MIFMENTQIMNEIIMEICTGKECKEMGKHDIIYRLNYTMCYLPFIMYKSLNAQMCLT